MDGERSEFDNCIAVLSDDRALGELLGGACRPIVCTNKTHTLNLLLYCLQDCNPDMMRMSFAYDNAPAGNSFYGLW